MFYDKATHRLSHGAARYLVVRSHSPRRLRFPAGERGVVQPSETGPANEEGMGKTHIGPSGNQQTHSIKNFNHTQGCQHTPKLTREGQRGAFLERPYKQQAGQTSFVEKPFSLTTGK